MSLVETFIACMLHDKYIGENKSWIQHSASVAVSTAMSLMLSVTFLLLCCY